MHNSHHAAAKRRAAACALADWMALWASAYYRVHVRQVGRVSAHVCVCYIICVHSARTLLCIADDNVIKPAYKGTQSSALACALLANIIL